MINVTESLINATSTAVSTANWKEQVPETLKLALKSAADYVSGNTYFDEQIQYHGITWKWTALKCLSGMVRITWADSIPFTKDWYNLLKGSYNMYLCNLGNVALSASWIIRAVNSAYPGVKDLGTLNVEGLGMLNNVTQINRDHVALGYFDTENPFAVHDSALQGIGFREAKSFAIFQNDQASLVVNDSSFNATYGFDALHTTGYKMTCLSSELKPNELVDSIISDPNLPFKRDDDAQFVCTTYIPGSDAEGAIVPTKKGAALSIPLKRTADLAKKINVKTASYEEVEAIEQAHLDGVAMAEAFVKEIKEQEESISIQEAGEPAEPIIVTRVYKNEDGETFTSFHTSYLNGYGPPLDYLAGL